nr:uncharacterized protein LOC108172101 isoform X2 [Malus domestica]
MRRDHSAVIEVIQETSSEGDDAIKTNEAKNMPLLVYVSREKTLSSPSFQGWGAQCSYGDAMKLRQCFGPSKQFIKSLRQINKPDHMFIPRNNAQLNESPRLASCAYEDGTKWGKEEVTEPSIPLMLMVISYSYLWHASWFLIRFSGGRLLHRVSFALQRLDFSVL